MGGIDARSDALHIARVRVRGAVDTLCARLRFEAAIADLRPAALGLPPRAVLVVRRVTPPARLHMVASAPTMEFRRAVEAVLRDLARQARRPWVDPGVTNGDAVMFADEAELVACLARDWLRNSVQERWWWHSVLNGAGVEEWLRAYALARGEVLASSLALLASRSLAGAWVATLSAADADRAVSAVVRAYALPGSDVRSVPAAALSAPDARRHPGGPGAGVGARPQAQTTVVPAEAVRRLLTVVPEVGGAALAVSQRKLLAVALTVMRAPSWARAEQFVAALRVLEHVPAAAPAPGLGRPAPAPHAGCAPVPTACVCPATMASAAAPLVDREDRPAQSRQANPEDTPRKVGGSPWTSGPPPQPPVSRRAAPARDTDAAGGAPRHEPAARPEALDPAPRREPDYDPLYAPGTAAGPAETKTTPLSPLAPGTWEEVPAWFGLRRADTAFGGVFYLLNAALALDLYGDFTAPRPRGLALQPWDWLALVGQAWFGGAFVGDPVWDLLAELTGRATDEPPGQHFDPPREWTIPPAWLAPWGRVESVGVQVTRVRLRLHHPAGFPVCDVPRDPTRPPLAQARVLGGGYAELRDSALRRARRGTMPTPARQPTRQWLHWLLGFLRARLALALGEVDPRTVPAFVCRHRAEVVVSATALDVHLSLAQLPLPIRIAGLDRDTGWIPAAGRSLSFHFA